MAVYLIHFDEPFKHARHYLGFCDDSHHDTEDAIASRVAYHRKKRGSKLLKAVVEAGINFSVVRVWPGASRTFERRLKGTASTRYCPVCSGEKAYRRVSSEK